MWYKSGSLKVGFECGKAVAPHKCHIADPTMQCGSLEASNGLPKRSAEMGTEGGKLPSSEDIKKMRVQVRSPALRCTRLPER